MTDFLTRTEKDGLRKRAERWKALADDLDKIEDRDDLGGDNMGAEQLRIEARRDLALLDEIGALTKERDESALRYAEQCELTSEMRVNVDVYRRERDELRADFEWYAAHRATCTSIRPHGDHSCDCGLDKACRRWSKA